MRSLQWLTLAALAVGGVACVAESRGAAARAVRETLPNGRIMVSYEHLPATGAATLGSDLSIGVMEGDSNLIFGDIRGIEAGSDGTIYVLDYQASEVRAYDPDGHFLRKLTRRGKGPGEITEANGMVLLGDSALWIQDHGQWMNIAVDLNGHELKRIPMHVLNYSYMWNGTIDDRGRFWKPTSYSDEPRVYPPPLGLMEGHARAYLVSYDPATDVKDSVYVGDNAYRTFVSRNDRGGYSYRSVPYNPRAITIVDPSGGLWQTYGTAYRIARLDQHGDTTMVIAVDAPPVPVTQQDRERYITQTLESSPNDRRLAEQVADLMPEFKPAIAGLVLDDHDRLWVERTRADGAPKIYDVFRQDGEYLGTLTLGFDASDYLPLRIRYGRVYALVRDSLEVPSVVRTVPVPQFLR